MCARCIHSGLKSMSLAINKKQNIHINIEENVIKLSTKTKKIKFF